MSTIEIYCAEPVHDGQKVLIYRFGRGESGWINASSWVRAGSPRSGRIAGMDASYGLLDGDRYLSPSERENGDLFGLADLRSRFEFKCRCGLKVVVRREKLDPVLDKLAAAGAPHISLRGLAAIV